jgi:cellulose synthase/poly-beta-1,6-N-acetylglucosamine synthase-like glycosyltransferase
VPLHREGRILPYLVRRLQSLDYPTDRLEVLLLIESDDIETRSALSNFVLPPHMRPVIVKAGQPRTKPRALNVGLAHARGEFLVIFDAEDRPERDQLRKAVATFRALPRRVICLQARLNFYNIRQSVLARVFAVDYVQWYYMLLPGLVGKRAFTPLGGTSNHFRIRALRRLGGWDPFNVTEDCDLGVRIARSGLDVALLDSTTWEEAVTRIRPWIRQRSRWVKGYFQTYLVHMRHPVRLWCEMGPRAFIGFQLLVGGSSLVLLLNPLMWLLTLTYMLSSATPLGAGIRSLFPPMIYYPSLLSLVVGNFLFFYSGLYACLRQGFVGLTRYALLNPIYWILMSVGAWVGFLDLLRHPHYWAKTEHGASLPLSHRASSPLALAGDTMRGERPQLSIVIPAYNEARRLPKSLQRLRDYVNGGTASYEVIVVDDGSSDETGKIVEEWMRAWPQLSLVRAPHRGKGGAIREGTLAACGAYVAFADADLSVAPEQFIRSGLELLDHYDIAIASREAPGALRLGEPALRRLMSRTFNTIVQLLLLPGIHDTQCGFKMLRREVARDFCSVQTIDGWGYDMELLYIARLRGYSVREVPIVNHYGQGSRVSPLRDSLRLLRDLRAVRSNGACGVYDDGNMPLPVPHLIGAGMVEHAG